MKLIRQWEIIELVLGQNARPTSFKALPRAQKWEFQQNEKKQGLYGPTLDYNG